MPVVAIPVSLIGGVFLMQAFGFTLNLLTLLAIVLSVGLVVDDAIVVVENVERHIREGRTPYHAALLGARELVGPVVAMTITLAAVYVPIGIQGGLTGALFREFAFTLAGAVFISGVVALTLSPVMSSRLLRSEHQHRWFARKVESAFDRLRTRYDKMLAGTLRYPPGGVRGLDRPRDPARAAVHVLARRAGAARGPELPVRRHRRARQRVTRAGDHVLVAGRQGVPEHARVRAATSRSASPPAASAGWR